MIGRGLALLSIVWLLVTCKTETYKQGRLIYEVNCGNCHMADGKGLGEMYPDITRSEYLTTLRHELPCLIRHGKQGEMLSTVAMPANERLTPVAINNLINYISYTWGDKQVSNPKNVEEQLDNCQ